YSTEKDLVEIFLRYDTMDEGVLLRFSHIQNMHIDTNRDYDFELVGSTALLLENNSVIWLSDDSWGNQSKEHLDEIKQNTTWVEAERLFWAITDADGNPVEMPPERINQVWIMDEKREEKHFDLKAFNGDWNDVLSHRTW
ncbi:MAG: hypothetical protein K2J55_04730, partial [Eubacterium sp.]|nr:hypothetical protein [Eubacterium sp.]